MIIYTCKIYVVVCIYIHKCLHLYAWCFFTLNIYECTWKCLLIVFVFQNTLTHTTININFGMMVAIQCCVCVSVPTFNSSEFQNSTTLCKKNKNKIMKTWLLHKQVVLNNNNKCNEYKRIKKKNKLNNENNNSTRVSTRPMHQKHFGNNRKNNIVSGSTRSGVIAPFKQPTTQIQ